MDSLASGALVTIARECSITFTFRTRYYADALIGSVIVLEALVSCNVMVASSKKEVLFLSNAHEVLTKGKVHLHVRG